MYLRFISFILRSRYGGGGEGRDGENGTRRRRWFLLSYFYIIAVCIYMLYGKAYLHIAVFARAGRVRTIVHALSSPEVMLVVSSPPSFATTTEGVAALSYTRYFPVGRAVLGRTDGKTDKTDRHDRPTGTDTQTRQTRHSGF